VNNNYNTDNKYQGILLVTDKDGNPVTDTDKLRKVEYRIIEIKEDDARQHETREEPDRPQLPDYSEDELKTSACTATTTDTAPNSDKNAF